MLGAHRRRRAYERRVRIGGPAMSRAIDSVVERGYRIPGARFGSQYVLDAVSWSVALVLAVWARYEFDLDSISWWPMLAIIAGAWIVQFLTGWMFHLYRGRFTYGTFEEVQALAVAVLVAAVLLGLPVVLFGSEFGVPRSVVLIATPIALLGMFSIRYGKRLYVEHKSRPSKDAEPTLIFGAGYLGSALVRRMTTDGEALYRPVGLIDDDPSKKNVQIRSVRVLGELDDLPDVVERVGASILIVAIARADSDLLRRVYDTAKPLGLSVKVMPALSDILDGKTRPSDVRDLGIEDLIGRHPVDTDVASIAGYLEGRRVLVTGAGGSIGSELCRQIAGYHPAELIMLDRDETGLQQAQIGTVGHGLLHTKDVVLCDIRDADALLNIFDERRPDVVFHAAALKHLPMLEQYPDEAWKTNVLGTLNVLEAAHAVGVRTFVNISTDKAANPTSVLGHSKRVAEKLTAWMAQTSGATYLSVRFGNVLGSRGSMLPTFAQLIASGGPVTVTHPDATRYFMTIPEASQLVIQAGAIGRPSEVLILDMGEPVRILDVAERMIAMSGRDVPIVYTGLREGEKLHEELVGSAENIQRLHHPLISHARVDSISPDRLDKDGWLARMNLAPRDNDTTAVAVARGGVPE